MRSYLYRDGDCIPTLEVRMGVYPAKSSLCYFCVRETLLQLLKQSEKLQDAASVNPNPQDPLCPANPTS